MLRNRVTVEATTYDFIEDVPSLQAEKDEVKGIEDHIPSGDVVGVVLCLRNRFCLIRLATIISEVRCERSDVRGFLCVCVFGIVTLDDVDLAMKLRNWRGSTNSSNCNQDQETYRTHHNDHIAIKKVRGYRNIQMA